MRTLLIVALLLFSRSVLAQQRPAITGIAFARFYTADAAAAEHFYAGILGYTGDTTDAITTYPVNPQQWIETAPLARGQAVPSHLAAVGFTTRDAAALSRYLAAKGFPPEQPISSGRFCVIDPERNRICFVQTGAGPVKAPAALPARATSTRLIHAGFAVHSAAVEDRFYRDVLGFHPYWHGGMTESHTDWSSLQVPEGTDWLEYMLETPKPGDLHMLGVLNHISLGTTDMQDVVAKLKRNGCVGLNCTKSQIGKDGKVQLNLFDPDQSRIEYMEFTPREQPCCSPFTGRQPTAVEDR